jgi:hypothetical protein
MPCLSHPPWLDHSSYTWRRVQVMKTQRNTLPKSPGSKSNPRKESAIKLNLRAWKLRYISRRPVSERSHVDSHCCEN